MTHYLRSSFRPASPKRWEVVGAIRVGFNNGISTLNFGQKSPILRKRLFIGVISYHHIFFGQRRGRIVGIFWVFFCQVCLDLRLFCLNPRFVQYVPFCNDHMSRHVEHDVSKMCWMNRNLLRYVSFVLFCFCCFFRDDSTLVLAFCWCCSKKRWT